MKLTMIIGGILIATLFTVAVKAQPNPGGPGTSGGASAPSDYQDVQVPFDGGMSIILIASGIGLGAKRLKQKE